MKALLSDKGVGRDLMRRADRVADAARRGAPVVSGEYRDGITTWSDRTDRTVARVGSTARHAPLVESRTGNMARALDSAGGEE